MSAPLDPIDVAGGGADPRTPVLLDWMSAAPYMPWWERDDPFFQAELWERPPIWRFRSRIEHIQMTTAGSRRAWRTVAVPDFVDSSNRISRRGRATRSTLAALNGWKHLTSKQIATFASVPQGSTGHALKPAFDAGLVEKGRFDMREIRWRAPYLWRIRPGPELREFLAGLDVEQRSAITLGRKAGPPRPHVRHDVITSELALRLAETVRGCHGIFPEAIVDAGRLLGRPDAGFSPDLVLVRSDGLRIAIEVTLNAKRSELESKMRRWGRLLGPHSWHDTGVVVVFFNAAADQTGVATRLRRAHQIALSASGLATDGISATHDQVLNARSQIHVAAWRDWFPLPWEIAEEGAQMVTRFSRDGENWSRVSVADPGALPFRPVRPEVWTAPARTRHQVGCCPEWAGGLPLSFGDRDSAVPGVSSPRKARQAAQDGAPAPLNAGAGEHRSEP